MATPLKEENLDTGYDSFIKFFLQTVDTNNIVVNFLTMIPHFAPIPCCLVIAELVSPFLFQIRPL